MTFVWSYHKEARKEENIIELFNLYKFCKMKVNEET